MAHTRREGSEGGTRREGVAGGGTRREGPAAGGGTRREGFGAGGGTRREGVPSGDGSPRVNLPVGLAERFRFVADLASGVEGFVQRVEDVAGTSFVVKLYHHNLSFDDEASRLLASADSAHVVGLLEAGPAPGWSRYEVLEWCEHGSLRDLITGVDEFELTAMVAELAEALEHIHSLRLDDDPHARLVHRDLKPENVLVRSLEPWDLVLGDFGLARMIAGTRHYTKRQQGSRPWAPPSGEAITPGWDWWSLGMIVAEVAAGRHPFQSDEGWMEDEAISDYLSQNPVDLSGVGDDRARHLCRGLLTRRTADRWGAAEVRRWLAGEDVPVAADSGAVRTGADGRDRPRRTVRFAGTACTSAAALALAFLDDWDQAQERVIQQTDNGALRQQVILLLTDEGLTGALELLKDDTGPPARLANLLVEMNPDLPPVYKGNDLRPGAIIRRLTEPSTMADELRLIEHAKYGILQTGILHCWAGLEGMDRTGEVEGRLKDAHKFVRNQKSTLDRLGADGAGGGTAVDRAKAAIYAAAMDAANAEVTRQALADSDTSAAAEQDWWKTLAGMPGDYAPALALAAEPVAREETEKARAKKKAAAEEAKRAAAAARRDENQRRQDERQRRVDNLRPADVRVLWWVLFLLVPSVGVGFWRIYETLEPDAVLTQELGALFEAAPWAMIWGALRAGAFAALGIGALVLLKRGRFGDRPVGLALAGALAVGAAASWVSGPDAVEDAIGDAHVAMFTNPIPGSRIDTCGGLSVWTNESDGTKTFVDDSCRVVQSYTGWFEQWRFPTSRIGALASIGPVYLVTDEAFERVIALDETNGAVVWEKTCSQGIVLDDSMFDAGDDTPTGQVVAGSCDGVAFRLDPMTGAPV